MVTSNVHFIFLSNKLNGNEVQLVILKQNTFKDYVICSLQCLTGLVMVLKRAVLLFPVIQMTTILFK